MHERARDRPCCRAMGLPLATALLGLVLANGRLAAYVVGPRVRRPAAMSADQQGKSKDGPTDADDTPPPLENQLSLFASLRARQVVIDQAVHRRWREGQVSTRVPITLNDWVRRLALDWPLAACGTARGGLVIVDLDAGTMLACAQTAHPGVVSTPEVARDMRLLNGDYDGNGVLAVAMLGDRVVSAGREGGVRVWKLVGDEILHESDLKTDVLASALLLPDSEEGPLWGAFLDGSLRKWTHLASCESTGEEPSIVISCGAPVLSAACCPALGVIAAATEKGTVELFDMEDGAPCGEWKPLAFDGSKGFKGARARAVNFLQDETTGVWNLFVGGSDGSIHRRALLRPIINHTNASDVTSGTGVSLFDDCVTKLLPSHQGSVVTLTPGPCGLLVSGAHDGTLRIWDVVDEEKPTCLYGFGGYKVWLGSVCTDGRRLVSDGSDNSLVLHDFSADAVMDDEHT